MPPKKKRLKKRKGPTKKKAQEILDDGSIRGRPLTKKQNRFFRHIVEDGRPKKRKTNKRR